MRTGVTFVDTDLIKQAGVVSVVIVSGIERGVLGAFSGLLQRLIDIAATGHGPRGPA